MANVVFVPVSHSAQTNANIPIHSAALSNQEKQNDWNQRAIRLTFLCLGCLLILGGIVGAVALRFTAVTYDSVATGQPTDVGTLQVTKHESNGKTKHESNGKTEGYSCEFPISYSFTVEGQFYEGDDVVKFPQSKSSCEDEAEKARRAFFYSEDFVVWYDPGNPNDNFYNKPLSPAQKAGVTGGLLCCFGLVLIFLVWLLCGKSSGRSCKSESYSMDEAMPATTQNAAISSPASLAKIGHSTSKNSNSIPQYSA